LYVGKEVTDVLDLNGAVLVGHSLGAAIALRFAINYRQELAGIVLVGGGMKMPVNPFFLEFLKTNPPIVPAEVIDLICKYSLAKENRPKFLLHCKKVFPNQRLMFYTVISWRVITWT